jgi:hypothetical protein
MREKWNIAFAAHNSAELRLVSAEGIAQPPNSRSPASQRNTVDKAGHGIVATDRAQAFTLTHRVGEHLA